MQGIATNAKMSLGALGLALALALAVPPQAAALDMADPPAAQPPGAEGPGAKAEGAKARGAKALIPGGPEDGTALWWNDTGIREALSISEEQLKKMNEYLKAYREKVPPSAQVDVFHETLVQADWKQARSENEKIADRAETSVRMRGDFKVDVLSLLTKEQHQTLVDRFPRLIYKPWTRAMRGREAR